MKKIFFLLFALSACFSAAGQGRQYTVKEIPNVQLTDSRRFVSNPDGLLSPDAVYKIDTMLYALRQSGRAQVAVIAVNSIGNADPFDFLHRLMDKDTGWGVGEAGKDNGLGILLVVDQGTIEIQTGRGLEGDLPDALVKRVINNYMLPAFRERHWDRGMVAGVAAFKGILDGVIPTGLDASPDEEGGWILGLAVVLLIIIPLAIVATAAYFSGRCPKCRKRALKRTGRRIVRKNGRKVEEITYVCQNCGHVVVRDHNYHDNSGIGPIIGGGMGGGFGGGFGGGSGGSSGGSWGGGSFGGGGARGKF